jgi:predicted DCC family thiol-disulfide oxidoreductase YuxK
MSGMPGRDHTLRHIFRHLGPALRFEDLNEQDLSDWGVTLDQAARRLHVLKNGQVWSGIPAFLILWQDLLRYRWLARVVGWPGVRHLAVLIYDWILAPVLYRWHLRRVRRVRRKRV